MTARITHAATLVALILPAGAPPARAQPATADTPQQIVVSANPFGSGGSPSPASVLTGEALVQRRAATLAETLDGLPGVASGGFGPNASRPVIRGQDGDRIRLLANGGSSPDVSGLSFDHAVPLDPLVIERIEVLRGPAALLHGGSAIGGVVNALDKRIPRARAQGLGGAVELRLGGAAAERAASALLEGGTGMAAGAGADSLAWHVDGFTRETGDLRVPAFDRPLPGGSAERRRRVANSASRSEGGAVGVSRLWDSGHAGLSLDTYRSRYGIVVEDDVQIRLQRDRLALAGEQRWRSGPLAMLRWQASASNYRHQELDATGAVGTTFRQRGQDLRVEAIQRAWPLAGGQWETTLGAQLESAELSALGDEAFVPGTRTRQAAVFALGRWTRADQAQLSAGLRQETVRVRSDGDAPGADPQFGPAQARRFAPRAASLGALWPLATPWQLQAQATWSERAPTAYELYARGVHAATAQFERGDPAQALERGHNLDLALAWRDGPHQARIGAFASRFSNYLLLAATGEPDVVTGDGEAFPVHAFRGVPARLHGWEAEGLWRLGEAAGGTLDLETRFDTVRGRDLATGEPLPRLAPRRSTLALAWQAGPWRLRAEWQQAAAQQRVPLGDTATPGWQQWHLAASRRITLAEREALLFARLTNAGDALALRATAPVAARARSPLPGRAVSAGVRISL